MNVLDIILSLMLLAAVVEGIFKGLTEQVVALVAVFAGAWVAFKFTNHVCGYVHPYIQISDKLLYVIVFILMVSLVICLFTLLGKVVKATIRFAMLGWLDRLLGGVFGLVKAALVLGIVIVLFNALNSTFSFVPESTLEQSVVYARLKTAAFSVFPYFKSLFS